MLDQQIDKSFKYQLTLMRQKEQLSKRLTELEQNPTYQAELTQNLMMMEQEMGKMRQQNKEMIAQQNKQGRAIVRETKNQDEHTDQSEVTLKIRHDEYNYVIANLSKAEARELTNKQKITEMNAKIESLQELAKVLNE